MSSNRAHGDKNQDNYSMDAAKHNTLGLNSTLYLAYRDIPVLLDKHLFSKTKKKGYRVLDFGCGAGLSTELIAKMITDAGFESEIVGIDVSEENINFAKQRLSKGKFIKVNPGEALNSLGEFDLVICNFVLVENKQESMPEILKMVNSLLNETGVSLVTNCSSKAYKRSNKWYTFNNNFDENVPTEKVGEKTKFKEDQPIKVQVYAAFGSSDSFTFFDFFHSGAAYKKAYMEAGLNLLETHKPLGKKNTDGIKWEAEAQFSPYKIHILSKQSGLNSELKVSKTL
jgi:2-polyprenyl-3-methyl-5-hydroxy-6-metoxy-1,4-benzoquinol methylase